MYDAAVFDCDGVLVDISESYDAVVDLACRHVLREHAGVESARIDKQVIDRFKACGGFNDEVDLTYACVLCCYAAHAEGRDARDVLLETAGAADRTGVESVLERLRGVDGMEALVSRLGELGDRRANPVYSVFDQIFYGPELYRRMSGKESAFEGPGMIENDRLILSDRLLAWLRGAFGRRMAIVTGRGLESIRHSLGPMLGSFDLDSSAFLEDEPRELAKPNPAALVRAAESMGSRDCLYVGDSMEDLMMSRDASSPGRRISFCGVVDSTPDPQGRRAMFEREGAEMVLGSVLDLPGRLEASGYKRADARPAP